MSSSADNNPSRRRVAGQRGRPRPAALKPVAGAGASTREAMPATGSTSASATAASATAPPATAPEHGPLRSGRRPSWLVAGSALLIASTGLVTSSVLWHGAEDRRTLASNQSAAASSARTIVEKMLGYDYTTFDRHTTEVSALLTGSFKKEFVQVATEVVKPLAVQNQAVILAKASAVSVMSTSDQGTVKILAFVDQTTTSAKLKRAQVDQNRVILTMSQTDGRWLVSKVEAF